MSQEQEILKVENFSVFEQLPLLTRTHWRPIYDFVDSVRPNNALIDVQILPFSTYKPTEKMLMNGYVDNDGFQHVFYSLMNGFEEGIDTRDDFKVRKGSTVDIFSKASRGDIALTSAYIEINPEKVDRKNLKISYLVYRYMSGALDDPYYLNPEEEVTDISSDGIKKKAEFLRTWLSKSKKEIENFSHVRSIAMGVLNEVWLTDVFNYFLKLRGIDDHQFIPAPYFLDASDPGVSNGGDILLTKTVDNETYAIALIDAKLGKDSRAPLAAGYNKYSDSPRIAIPIGGLDLIIQGHKVKPSQYIRHLRDNIDAYDWDEPLQGMSSEQIAEFNLGLIKLFGYSVDLAKWAFGSELTEQHNNNQIKKLGDLENLLERLTI